LINAKKKSDFHVGQIFFYLESKADKTSTPSKKLFMLEIKKLVVIKVGREYIYFENSRYKIGSDYTEYFWGRGEWRNGTHRSKILETWLDASDEIDRLDTIKRLSDNWEVRKYLERFSQNLLSLMESENDRISRLGE
jgi:hypothetical protein